MKYNSTLNSIINLKLTQESGQTSQPPWKNVENQYCDIIKIKNQPILIKTSQSNINILNIDCELPISNSNSSIDKKSIEKEISRIYDLNFNLKKFYNYLSEDVRLEPSIDFCKGLRLFLAKDPFECIISSITSANNSITRWTKSIVKIREKWGEFHEFPSGRFYNFPGTKNLMKSLEDNFKEYKYKSNNNINIIEGLKSCGVGYRAQYIEKASKLFTFETDLFEISKMNYDEAFNTLQEIPGIGPKVADCILLYGYGMKKAFPSDIWIKRIISHLYFNGKEISPKKTREFGMEQFGEYAGYVQLYLFHYARKSGLIKKLK